MQPPRPNLVRYGKTGNDRNAESGFDSTLDCLRLTNRMRDQLRRYHPSFSQVASELGPPWVLELWRLAPSPEAARKAKRAKVEGS